MRVPVSCASICGLLGENYKAVPESIAILLDKLLKRREELRLESEALDNLISTYKKIQKLRQDAGEFTGQLHLWHGGSKRALQSAQVTEMLDATRRIIVAEGRPMKRGELVKVLEARGFTIAGSDKNKVFGTNIWRSGKFRHVHGEGYWPVDVDLPTDLI